MSTEANSETTAPANPEKPAPVGDGRDGVALRPLSPLFGHSYKSGETISAVVLDLLSPQAKRSLVNSHFLEVPGMSSEGGAANAHFKAKVDKLSEDHKKLVSQNAVLMQANDDLVKRVAALEAGSGKAPKATRRQQSGAPAAVLKE